MRCSRLPIKILQKAAAVCDDEGVQIGERGLRVAGHMCDDAAEDVWVEGSGSDGFGRGERMREGGLRGMSRDLR